MKNIEFTKEQEIKLRADCERLGAIFVKITKLKGNEKYREGLLTELQLTDYDVVSRSYKNPNTNIYFIQRLVGCFRKALLDYNQKIDAVFDEWIKS